MPYPLTALAVLNLAANLDIDSIVVATLQASAKQIEVMASGNQIHYPVLRGKYLGG